MTTTTQMQGGPSITPTPIRNLIFITSGIILFSALTEPLFRIIFGWPGLSSLLSLSWYGLRSFYLWQIVSFLFVEETYNQGVSISLLIGLTFNMYLLWAMGSDLFAYIGKNSFLRFYFLSGICAGLVALITMAFLGVGGRLSGPTPAILAVMTAWTLFHPELNLLLFFVLPIKAKWIWAGLVGALILVSLSHLDWVTLAFYMGGVLFGYIYAVMAWDLESPFVWTHRFDRFLRSLGKGLQSTLRKVKKQKGTVIDFKTGEPLLDDNHFVDAMLEKISKQGESSLTWKERQRLHDISQSRQKKK